MGQRLNLEIVDEDGKVLANAYYHWSGYTGSAVGIAQTVLESIENMPAYGDPVIWAIKLLETTGAGLTEDDERWVTQNISGYERYNFQAAVDRNNGLISITPEGIEQTRNWEEARVTICPVTQVINFEAVWINTKEEYERNYEEDSLLTYNDLLQYDVDFGNISFNDFDDFAFFITRLLEESVYEFRLASGNVAGLIA